MAERPGWKWRRTLLTALLLSVSVAAHALGVATPEVMSGFNEPLKARVALLNTGDLRADDIRVSLADSVRWQAMEVARSADADTLRLAVEGSPGHLYLDVRGSRPLATPWLDVVLTLRWPQGELTPQLTLLPSKNAATHGESAAVNVPSMAGDRRSSVSQAGETRHQGMDPRTREPSASASDNQRIVALEERVNRLEQQLRASQTSQAALTTEIESVRARSLADQSTFDSTVVATLESRQQAFETRLNQLDQDMLAAGVAASDATSQHAPSTQATDTSSQKSAEAPVPEPPVVDHGRSFVWTWAIAALLMILAGLWAGIRRWRQQRYRFVSVAELSPLTSSSSSFPANEASTGEAVGNAQSAEAARGEQNEAWTAQRAQIEAICAEAGVFHHHGRREHALAMLEEGLLHYPGDAHLMRTLAALKAAPDPDSGEARGDGDALLQSAVSTPAFAPVWSLQSFPIEEERIDTLQGSTSGNVTGQGMDFAMTPAAGFPGDWALEEVAFEDPDTDNKRPDVDRFSGHA